MEKILRKTEVCGKPLLAVLRGETMQPPPVWLMRQAGRYLPEYRALRAQAGGFLDLVFDPEKAAEITIQPRRRFDLDALIVFSDILVVPLALGQDLHFSEGEGPVMTPLESDRIAGLEENFVKAEAVYAPVYETLERVVEKRGAEGFSDAALLGFCGGPWSVAAYMIDGQARTGFSRALDWAARQAEDLDRLLARLAEASLPYLEGQVRAGAEALQIFESHAGVLHGEDFHRFVIIPTRNLVEKLRQRHPDIPVIGFPRGASAADRRAYFQETGIDALGLDQNVNPQEARDLQQNGPVQGHLAPDLLCRGGPPMLKAAGAIIENLSGGPFIFNLGHGVMKETPPENVAALVDFVKKGKR